MIICYFYTQKGTLFKKETVAISKYRPKGYSKIDNVYEKRLAKQFHMANCPQKALRGLSFNFSFLHFPVSPLKIGKKFFKAN